MVITLARKNKVEESPHFNEIVKRLSEGESGRKVSAWLENTYNEKISFAALNRYKSKNIRMEDRVEAELNKRAKKKKKKPKKNKKVQAQTEKEVQRQADEKETAEETINSVAETIAINMEGVASVAAQFPERFEEACKDAKDPDSNVTSKDVARLSLDANKLYNEYFKQDEPVEVNINNGLIGLAESIEKSKKEYSVE